MECGATSTETMVNRSSVRPRSHLRQLATAPPSTATLVTTRTMSCTLRSLARTPYLVRVARSGTCRTILHSRVASKLWATSLSLACRSPSLIYLADARMMLALWACIGRWKKLDSTSVFSLQDRDSTYFELEAYRMSMNFHPRFVTSIPFIEFEPVLVIVNDLNSYVICISCMARAED